MNYTKLIKSIIFIYENNKKLINLIKIKKNLFFLKKKKKSVKAEKKVNEKRSLF